MNSVCLHCTKMVEVWFLLRYPVYGPFQDSLSAAVQGLWKLMLCSFTEERASIP